MEARRPRRLGLALAWASLLVGAAAAGHVVYGSATLRMLSLQSDAVVRVRILDPDAEVALAQQGLREAVVVARVLERIKGPEDLGEIVRFAQHGHGVPKYVAGEEVAVFLQRIERNRELGGSPLAAQLRWVSVQEAGTRFPLDDASRDGFVAALRSYAQIERLPAKEQPAALRRLTVGLAGAPDLRLASSAVSDIALARTAPIVTAEDVPALDRLIATDATSIGVRVGLLAELERRGLVEAPPRWARLLRETRGADRLTAVRAAAAHPSPAVTAALVELLSDGDPLLVATAAVSLGTPGSAAALEPLAGLLASEDERVRMGAIRGLGGVATPAARARLEQAAASHPDAATRRRAAAEVRAIAQRRSDRAD